jgi:CMP-N-acetylneuraminic acid synthetase
MIDTGMDQLQLIAIIPARGGSKRLPGKNILPILGKPLLAYTLETARLWGKFHRILVNSEDPAILAAAQDYGAEIYRRPPSLSDDQAKVLAVVQEQIRTMQLDLDRTVVAVLLPTCPLLAVKDLEGAFALFLKGGCKGAVVSVTQYEKAPEQALLIDAQGRLSQKYPESYSSKSQDHGPAYRYNTAMVFNTAGGILAQTDIVGRNSLAYEMPFERSIDIDYDYHVRVVEALLLYAPPGRDA